MQKSKPRNYKKLLEEDGFVIFRDFLPQQFSYELVEKLLDVEKNWEYHSVLDYGENPFVKNVKREALQLYNLSRYSHNFLYVAMLYKESCERSKKLYLTLEKTIS